jgi:hypothetical protein
MTNGVPQGSTLSPILFDVFIESLGRRLREAGIFFRLYADDLIVIGDDHEVRRAAIIAEEWARSTNMEVNRRKSGLLPIDGSSFRVGEEIDGYPVVSSYKYLGLLINGELDLRDHLR